jgi:hypothetical protein
MSEIEILGQKYEYEKSEIVDVYMKQIAVLTKQTGTDTKVIEEQTIVLIKQMSMDINKLKEKYAGDRR